MFLRECMSIAKKLTERLDFSKILLFLSSQMTHQVDAIVASSLFLSAPHLDFNLVGLLKYSSSVCSLLILTYCWLLMMQHFCLIFFCLQTLPHLQMWNLLLIERSLLCLWLGFQFWYFPSLCWEFRDWFLGAKGGKRTIRCTKVFWTITLIHILPTSCCI